MKKTLDEVIKAVDYCTFSSDCNPCPYKEDKECNRAKMTDALHYLKEYKNTDENYKKAIAHVTEVIDHYEKMVADYLAVNNPPLTWDELKTMQGKPVWVEYENYASDWEIIENVGTFKWADGLFVETNTSILHKEDQGKTWQAYRKERK